MKTRLLPALFALALPLLSQQDAAAAPAENLFYKAYWLEKGERNFAEAMTLYDQFLTQAPEHRLAKFAATNELDLLTRAGKTKEADAFAKKYEKLLGNVAVGAPARGDGERAAGGGQAGGDGARGEGGQRRGNFDPQARLAELKKQLEDAKAAGDTEKAAQLEARIKQMEQMAAGGGGQGNGQGGGRRGGFGGAPVEFAKMDKAQLEQFKKDRLEPMNQFVTRMRENGNEERAKQLEEGVASLKKAIDDGKLDEAQKIWDKMREGMRGGRRGGGGGDGAGANGGGGGAPPRGGGGGGGGF